MGRLTWAHFESVTNARIRGLRASVILVTLSIVAFLPFSACAQRVAETSQAAPIQTAAQVGVPRQASTQAQAATSTSAITSSGQPLVVFEDGQLSINASNASVADVLFALRATTGADIDVPVNAYSERVTAQLGPGPARKILADLLGWSSFDYIIEGSDEDPLAVHSVTLMVRSKGSGAGSTGPMTAGNSNGMRPNGPSPARAQTEVVATPDPVESTASGDNHSDQPAAPNDNATPSPGSQRPAVQSPVSTSAASSSAGGARSPSDMIQELQQMYQQRRAMQQQSNQTSGTARTSP